MWDTYLRDNLNAGVDRPLFDQTLVATATTIDITGIPATFAHLELVIYARTDRAATGDLILVRFNNDSGANYNRHYIDATAGTITAAAETVQTAMRAPVVTGASAPASVFGGGTIVMPHYAGTTGTKCAYTVGGAVTVNQTEIATGQWASTNAVNRVTLLPANGPNFIIGCRVTLYGKGAV